MSQIRQSSWGSILIMALILGGLAALIGVFDPAGESSNLSMIRDASACGGAPTPTPTYDPPEAPPSQDPTVTPNPEDVDPPDNPSNHCDNPTDGKPKNPCEKCGTTGDPIDVYHRRFYREDYDLSIPVKHGLDLTVARRYNSFGNQIDPSKISSAAFGYNTNENWFLKRYESKVEIAYWREMFLLDGNGERLFLADLLPVGDSLSGSHCEAHPCECVDRNYSYAYAILLGSNTSVQQPEHLLKYTTEDGSTILFKYADTFKTSEQSNDGLKLRKPNESNWGNAFWVSKFVPGTHGYSPIDVEGVGALPARETPSQIEMYVLHSYGTYHNSAARQPYQLPYGEPNFYDCDPLDGCSDKHYDIPYIPYYYYHWMTSAAYDKIYDPSIHPNLTEMGINGYVVRYDDGRQYHYDANGRLLYYDANWRNNVEDSSGYHVDDYIEVEWSGNLISKIKAPPSDGRELQLNYTNNAVTSIDFKPSDPLEPEISNILTYGYHDSGDEAGKLKRVTPYNGAKYGLQYDYGDIQFNGNLVEHLPVSGKDPKLCLVSEFKGQTVNPLLAINYDYSPSDGKYPVTDQWVRDPNENIWRMNLAIETMLDEGIKVLYGAGEKPDGTGRYDGLASGSPSIPATIMYFNDVTDVDRYEYSNVSEVPQTRTVYVQGTRLVDYVQLFVGSDMQRDDHWTTTTAYDYVDPASGVDQIWRTTYYASFTGNDTIGYTAEDPTTTTYHYGDSDLPLWPTKINSSDGSSVELVYTDEGQLSKRTQKQFNNETETTDTLVTTDYLYVSSGGVKQGLLWRIATTVNGTTKNTDLDYYASTDYTLGQICGQLKSILSDGETTTYQYNASGQTTSVNHAGEQTTYNYSTNFYPPRLTSIVDPTQATTTYQYNDHGRVSAVTNALSQVTQYLYDYQGNLEQVNTPDVGGSAQTKMEYDIYGRMVLLTDPEGNGTVYEYDEFGRLVAEKSYGVDTGTAGYDDQTPLYTISYAYVGSGGGAACGICSGGGSDTIASRTITDGTDTETIHYTYDLLGRLTTMTDEVNSQSGRTITYTYNDGKLESVNHGAGGLWASNLISYEYDDPHGRLSREVYPNGRYIEFQYDSIGRPTHIKDPFGYINKINYDDTNDGRLDTLQHSTLGTASFSYNTEDLLSGITLGNSAYTAFGYDTHERLTSFDHLNASAGRLIKHAWTYDSLGRKASSDPYQDIIVTIPGQYDPAINIAYDAAGRVTREDYNHEQGDYKWESTFSYDKAGNRVTDTSYNWAIPFFNRILSYTYGAGNRETGIAGSYYPNNGSLAPLNYDYKGNVTSRTPIHGGSAYSYTWDAYDRLTSVARTGQTTVDYTYDAGGRLLKRTEGSEVTINYWLGLHKIAEERWGAESGKSLVVFRPDAETAAAPTGNGWYALTGVTQMGYVTDGLRYDALRIDATSGGQYDAVALIGEDMPEGNVNPNDVDWAEADRRHLGFWMRNADGRAVKLSVHTDTTLDDETKIEIMTASGTDSYNGFTKIYSIYLGTALNDGQWHYVELDLKSRVAALNASDTIQAFNGMRVECNDLYLDDIVLSGGELHRSYQLIPGAAIGAALGAQDGGDGVALGERWYYHYDDLGSVVATTDEAGAQVGVYVPDHWGNYRLVIGTRPDTMGLTGKFFDADAGLYYFNARWYDPERGHWMSEDPAGFIDGLNFYQFTRNNPSNFFDLTGMFTQAQCNELLRRILLKGGKLLKKIRNYIPEDDALGGWPMAGGGETKPGGHWIQIMDLIRGIKSDLALFVKECICNYGGPGAPPRYPKWVDEMADRHQHLEDPVEDSIEKDDFPVPFPPFLPLPRKRYGGGLDHLPMWNLL